MSTYISETRKIKVLNDILNKHVFVSCQIFVDQANGIEFFVVENIYPSSKPSFTGSIYHLKPIIHLGRVHGFSSCTFESISEKYNELWESIALKKIRYCPKES